MSNDTVVYFDICTVTTETERKWPPINISFPVGSIINQ